MFLTAQGDFSALGCLNQFGKTDHRRAPAPERNGRLAWLERVEVLQHVHQHEVEVVGVCGAARSPA